MMNEATMLRPAQPNDAERGAALLSSAYMHTQVVYQPQKDAENWFIQRLQHFFREDGNRFSYQFTYVAEHRSEVVGLILSFAGREEERLNAATGLQLEREAQDNEWYVDALAVFKDWGRRGIGTGLLHIAEQQARQQGYPHIALNVAQENEQALSLYQRLQYVITQQTFLYHRPHVRLVKQLEAE